MPSVPFRLCFLFAALFPFVASAQKPQGGGMLAVPPKAVVSDAFADPTPASGRFVPAKALKRPSPAYPELAWLNRVEGVVKFRFGIDDQGHVTTVDLLQTAGSVMLDNVVRDPVLTQWTFQPATLDGSPIASSLREEIEFRLDPEEQRQLAKVRLALEPNDLPNPPYPPNVPPGSAKGPCTIAVIWTDAGLVDLIYTDKTSGSTALDHAAMRWAYTHWRIDPKNIVHVYDKEHHEKAFLKTVTFTPPGDAS